LIDNVNNFTLEKIDACRSFYEQYIDNLYTKRLLSLDDAFTYKEIFPLFEPFYVFYDAEKSKYQPLSELSNSVFKE